MLRMMPNSAPLTSPGSQQELNKDFLLDLENQLKTQILQNPFARLSYPLLFRIIWEAESKIYGNGE
jgi:hypothetical protein